MNKLDRVLLIDDDEVICFLTELKLKQHNEKINVVIATNGKEAVRYMNKYTTDYPDLILLDINMPLMNGFEFLEWYHGNVQSRKLKIAMYSTSIRQEDKERSMAYEYVVDYIEKPLDEEKIESLLKKLTMLEF